MRYRFFKASPEVYESLRGAIDAAWGYPTQHTETSIPPAAVQFKDADGKCVMGVNEEWLSWEPVATLVPQMVSLGSVEEISEAEYWAILPQPAE